MNTVSGLCYPLPSAFPFPTVSTVYSSLFSSLLVAYYSSTFPYKQQQQIVIYIPKNNRTRQRGAIHSDERKRGEVFSECQNTCRRQRTYESSQEMYISLISLSGANNPPSIQVISLTTTSLQSMKTFSFLV